MNAKRLNQYIDGNTAAFDRTRTANDDCSTQLAQTCSRRLRWLGAQRHQNDAHTLPHDHNITNSKPGLWSRCRSCGDRDMETELTYILFRSMKLAINTFLLLVLISINGRRLTRIDRLEVCDYSRDPPFSLRDIRVVNAVDENVRISLAGTIFRRLVNPRFEAVVIRCLNKETLDTCEPFAVLKALNTCSLMVMRNMAWTNFVDAIHPHVRCPVSKGEYVLTNATIDGNLYKFFPIDNYYWRCNVSYYEVPGLRVGSMVELCQSERSQFNTSVMVIAHQEFPINQTRKPSAMGRACVGWPLPPMGHVCSLVAYLVLSIRVSC
ncbi:hypothetical protein CBL_04919 [Carabus blaptoides fortunei]